MRRPDPIDLDIIAQLREQPQMTNKAIAARTGIAESTVANRIRAMADDHVMRVVAQSDIFAGGYMLMCFIYIDTARRAVANIARDIAAIDEVTSVSQGIGSPELFVNVRARDATHLKQLINDRVGGVKGVARLRTEVCLDIAKFISGFGDLSAGLDGVELEDGGGTDDRIVSLLRKDGRMSNREVARRIGVSEGNVRGRLKKMADARVMRLGVVCDAASLGMGAVAMVRIATTPGRTGTLVSELAGIEAVAFLGSTTGEYNLTAALQCADLGELAALCDDRIASLRGVVDVRVHPLVSTAKHRYDLIRVG
ncbi:MAG: Lrp/AsnC family transcriptional regulator [Pseudomonadales bacterium]